MAKNSNENPNVIMASGTGFIEPTKCKFIDIIEKEGKNSCVYIMHGLPNRSLISSLPEKRLRNVDATRVNTNDVRLFMLNGFPFAVFLCHPFIGICDLELGTMSWIEKVRAENFYFMHLCGRYSWEVINKIFRESPIICIWSEVTSRITEERAVELNATMMRTRMYEIRFKGDLRIEHTKRFIKFKVDEITAKEMITEEKKFPKNEPKEKQFSNGKMMIESSEGFLECTDTSCKVPDFFDLSAVRTIHLY